MIEIGSALDPGRRRIGKQNQDSLCVIKPSLFYNRPPLLVIADGMGGYEGGAIASQLVVSSFQNAYERDYKHAGSGGSPIEMLQSGIEASLSALRQQAAQDDDLSKMGSTVVAAVLKDNNIYLINVGDSRAYLMNDHQVRQLSYDHSLVGEQLRQGIITEADVRHHPRRNVLSMSISAQREDVQAYTCTVAWQPGDFLVLCSDGLWGPVTEAQIQAVVLEYRPQQAADRLVFLANANQGPDNISVIVARNR